MPDVQKKTEQTRKITRKGLRNELPKCLVELSKEPVERISEIIIYYRDHPLNPIESRNALVVIIDKVNSANKMKSGSGFGNQAITCLFDFLNLGDFSEFENEKKGTNPIPAALFCS